MSFDKLKKQNSMESLTKELDKLNKGADSYKDARIWQPTNGGGTDRFASILKVTKASSFDGLAFFRSLGPFVPSVPWIQVEWVVDRQTQTLGLAYKSKEKARLV